MSTLSIQGSSGIEAVLLKIQGAILIVFTVYVNTVNTHWFELHETLN